MTSTVHTAKTQTEEGFKMLSYKPTKVYVLTIHLNHLDKTIRKMLFT